MFLSEHQGPVPKTLRIVYRGFQDDLPPKHWTSPIGPQHLVHWPQKKPFGIRFCRFPSRIHSPAKAGSGSARPGRVGRWGKPAIGENPGIPWLVVDLPL